MSKISELDRHKICELAFNSLREGSQESEEAMNYLLFNRKISLDVLDKLKFGYVPKRSNHFLKGRIIMPLFDSFDNLIALTTRDFRNKEYHGGHWHESFNKKRYLYGLNIAKNNIIKHNKSIVVEGQFDTAILHSFGINFTVGILGSAFQYDHICQLARYTNEIYLAFDSDDAGKSTMKKAIDFYKNKKLYNFGIKFIPVYLNSLSDNSKIEKDPDDFIKKYGKKDFVRLLKLSKEKEEQENFLNV